MLEKPFDRPIKLTDDPVLPAHNVKMTALEREYFKDLGLSDEQIDKFDSNYILTMSGLGKLIPTQRTKAMAELKDLVDQLKTLYGSDTDGFATALADIFQKAAQLSSNNIDDVKKLFEDKIKGMQAVQPELSPEEAQLEEILGQFTSSASTEITKDTYDKLIDLVLNKLHLIDKAPEADENGRFTLEFTYKEKPYTFFYANQTSSASQAESVSGASSDADPSDVQAFINGLTAKDDWTLENLIKACEESYFAAIIHVDETPSRSDDKYDYHKVTADGVDGYVEVPVLKAAAPEEKPVEKTAEDYAKEFDNTFDVSVLLAAKQAGFEVSIEKTSGEYYVYINAPNSDELWGCATWSTATEKDIQKLVDAGIRIDYYEDEISGYEDYFTPDEDNGTYSLNAEKLKAVFGEDAAAKIKTIEQLKSAVAAKEAAEAAAKQAAEAAEKQAQALSDWLEAHPNDSELDEDAFTAMKDIGLAYKVERFLEDKDGVDVPKITITIKGNKRTFVDKTEDALLPRTDEQKFQDTIDAFVGGYMKSSEFRKALEAFGCTNIRRATEEENGAFVWHFNGPDGKSYKAQCIYAAAKDGAGNDSANIVTGAITAEYYNTEVSDRSKYEPVAWKEGVPTHYALKQPITVNPFSTTDSVVYESEPTGTTPPEVQDAIEDFISGKMKSSEFRSKLESLGCTDIRRATEEENGAFVWHFTDPNGNKHVVSCKYAAAKDGNGENNDGGIIVIAITKAEYDALPDALKAFYKEVATENDEVSYYGRDPETTVAGKTYKQVEDDLEAKENEFKDFLEKIFENVNKPEGYTNPNARIESKDFATNFRNAISSINEYLKNHYPDLTSKALQECERAIVKKYGNTGATVKDLIDEYLRLVYSKVSAAPTDVELTNDEQEFINDVMDKSNEPDKSVEVWLLQKYHGTKTTPPAYFDNKPDVIYDIEDAIEALRKALKARFMSNGFTEDDFNRLFDANKSTIAHKYENITEPNTVSYKTVVDDFLKLMYNTDEFKAKLAESKAEWEKVVAFADKVKSDFSFTSVKNGTTVKDSTKVPKGAKIKEFDENGNVKSPNNTEVKQLFAQVFSVLKGYLGELNLNDAQLRSLIVAAWNAVVSGQTADMTASEFVGKLRNELLDILGDEEKYQAALKGEQLSGAENGAENQSDVTNSNNINDYVSEEDKALVTGYNDTSKTYIVGGSLHDTALYNSLDTLKSKVENYYVKMHGSSDGFDALWKKAKDSIVHGQNSYNLVIELGKEKVTVKDVVEALLKYFATELGGIYAPAGSDSGTGVRGNEADESKLIGLSEADKKKYFIYDEATKKYYINLSTISELFDDVITDADLRGKSVDDVIKVLRDKALNLDGIKMTYKGKEKSYKNNDEVTDTIETRNAESTRKAAHDLFKTLIRSKITNYIISHMGYNLTTAEIDKIMDDILNNNDSKVSGKISLTSITYSFNIKDAVDAFIEDLDAWLNGSVQKDGQLQYNNPSLQPYTVTVINDKGFGDLVNATIQLNNEEVPYFINDDGIYRLNIAVLNDKTKSPFAAYLNAGGRILNLEDLRKAVAYCTTITDKSSEVVKSKGTRTGKVLNEILNDSTARFNYNFKIGSDGSISFGTVARYAEGYYKGYYVRGWISPGWSSNGVTYEDIFGQEPDTTSVFNDLKAALESTYSAEITNVFGDDPQAKKNLFNLAMFRVLSGTTITDETKQNEIMKKVMTEYKNLLEKAAKDTTGTARDYIANYHNNMLNGKTPANMGGTKSQVENGTAYYVWDSTCGPDNKIDLERTFGKDTVYAIGNYTFTSGVTIKTVDCSHPDDTKPLNDAIFRLLTKYVNDLGAKLVAEGKTEQEIEAELIKLINRFNEAVEKAIVKVDSAECNDHTCRQDVYGFNDNNSDAKYRTKDDGFSTVQGCLLQIIYEMEAITAKSIFG